MSFLKINGHLLRCLSLLFANGQRNEQQKAFKIENNKPLIVIRNSKSYSFHWASELQCEDELVCPRTDFPIQKLEHRNIRTNDGWDMPCRCHIRSLSVPNQF